MSKILVKEELLNKNALVVMKLAGALSRYRAGDRLKPVNDLAKEINVSIGTTQYGLNFLREKEAVSLNARGHLGTFIEKVDYAKLMEFTGNTTRDCVMPLPYSLRYEGLATAFSQLGNRKGKFYLSFMNGSIRRIKSLLSGCYNCALSSRIAAIEAVSQGMAVEIAAAYGPQSYLETHVLVYRAKTQARIKTIGTDKESFDQALLLKSFLAKHPKVQVINLPYTHIIKRLLAGEVDATLWNIDYIKEHHPMLQFSPLELTSFQHSLTEAVLVVRSGDAATADYLTRRFPKQKVLKIQEAVFTGRRIPEY